MQTQGCGGSLLTGGIASLYPRLFISLRFLVLRTPLLLHNNDTDLSMITRYTFPCFARLCSCKTTNKLIHDYSLHFLVLRTLLLLHNYNTGLSMVTHYAFSCETRVIHYPWKRFVFPIPCFALLLIIGIQWILIPCNDIIIRRAFVVFEVREHCRFHRNVEIV